MHLGRLEPCVVLCQLELYAFELPYGRAEDLSSLDMVNARFEHFFRSASACGSHERARTVKTFHSIIEPFIPFTDKIVFGYLRLLDLYEAV